MNDIEDKQDKLNGPESVERRDFFTGIGKTTLLGALVLSLGGGVAWLTSTKTARAPDRRYQILRKNDITFFSSVLPVIIPHAKSAESQHIFLASMDSMLTPMNQASRAQLRKMVDVLTTFGIRNLLMKTLSDWPDLSAAEVDAILKSWRDSNREMLNVIYLTVTGLSNLAWYMVPEHQLESGYPGPPKKVLNDISGSGS